MSKFSDFCYSLVGIKYCLGGYDLSGVDCFGLFYYINREYYKSKVEYPLLFYVKKTYATKCFLLDYSESNLADLDEGCVLLMSHTSFPQHLLIAIDDHTVIHSLNPVGVLVSDFNDLLFSGWSVKKVYKRKFV